MSDNNGTKDHIPSAAEIANRARQGRRVAGSEPADPGDDSPPVDTSVAKPESPATAAPAADPAPGTEKPTRKRRQAAPPAEPVPATPVHDKSTVKPGYMFFMGQELPDPSMLPIEYRILVAKSLQEIRRQLDELSKLVQSRGEANGTTHTCTGSEVRRGAHGHDGRDVGDDAERHGEGAGQRHRPAPLLG